MLSKLALRNVKRSFKDYFIYIITVTLAFALIFAFNFIAFSHDLVELSSMMNNFKYAVIFVSIIIIFVIGFLINYTMRFMFSKRSKEFGTYMILGIEKKDINRLFLLENIILGALATILAFFLGILLTILLTAIIIHIFEMPYQISFSINPLSILLSLSYFVLIYLFALFKSNRRIKKMKIYDMLYFDKLNEQKIWRKKKSRTILFIISVILGIIGLYLVDIAFASFDNPSVMLRLLLGIILIIISIYGITITIGDFILHFVLKHKKLKYHNNNLFIARNYSSKIKTMGISLGTLALLSTLTLLCLNTSFLMKDAFENNVNQSVPYDIIIDTIYSEVENSSTGIFDCQDKWQQYREYIKNTYTIEDDLIYDIYTMEDKQIKNKIGDLGVNGYVGIDAYIKLSDYNKLLDMLGRDSISLDDDEYYVHGNKDLKEAMNYLNETKPLLTIGSSNLKLKKATNERFITGWGMGSSYFIIVPDQYVEGMKVLNRMNAINTKEETTEEFYQQISEDVGRIQMQGEYEGEKYTFEIDALKVRGNYLAMNRSAMTMFSFSLIYVALVFIAVVGTILSIQTLSDSTKYKYRYQLLKKLGVDQKDIYKTIKKQVMFNFIFPIIYPILIAIITTFSLNKLFGGVTSLEYTHIYSLIYSLIIFLFIYSIYFIATYFSFKKNIDE